MGEQWDYLIVTASNGSQASVYEAQLRLRRELGLLAGAREVLVIADPGGRRVGSGGSTIFCLMELLNRELAPEGGIDDRRAWKELLQRRRILIVHGGGDSKRLPAYGPCGKLFVPIPGENDSAVEATLFDRQLPAYLGLPEGPQGAGQVVIASGDVLLTFDPAEVRFDAPGMTGLGCYASPEQASSHGVYCTDGDGRIRLFLQKPSPAEQAARGAIDRYGRAILDIGVIGFDAATAVRLLTMCNVRPGPRDRLIWAGEMAGAIEAGGLDFYREICCAMGSEATCAQHLSSVRAASPGTSGTIAHIGWIGTA